MRCLALVTDAFGGYGGIAQYNRDVLKAIASLPGVERVDILPREVLDPPTGASQCIVQHRPIYNQVVYSLAAILEARHRPDVVFCGHLYHGPLAWLVAKACKARLICQLHGDEIWAPLSQLHLRPLKASDLVLCVSRDTLDRYAAQSGGLTNALVVPNTVGSEFVPGDRAAARERLNLTSETVILTVARLDARGGYKGHDRIIPLLNRLRQTTGDRKIIYVIAGEGDDKARLEALSKQYGVSASVRFLGKVGREELPDVYRSADLFALPSTGEGFGIAFLEAMGCGTPAIGLAVGGAPDALDGLGICVDEESFPTALAHALTAPRPDPVALSASVHARFGFSAFQARIAHAMSRLHASPLQS
jgi:phosphatidylinositol alpha-1,6-mannosyltransferase